MTNNGLIRDNINQFAFVYRLMDFLVIQFCLYFASWLHNGWYTINFLILALVANLCYSFVAEMFWLYRSWRSSAMKELLFNTLMSWAITLFPVMLFIFFSKSSEDYSRLSLGTWFVLTAYCLCGWRFAFRQFLFHMRRKGHNTRKVGIVGLSDGSGCRLANEILEHPEMGYKLIGVFDDRNASRLNTNYQSLYQGNVEDGVQRAKNGELDVLFIALPMTAKDRIDKILRLLGDTTVDVHLIPDFFVYNLLHARMGQVGNIQTVSIYDTPMRGGWSVLKRLEDLVLATIILAVIAVPMLAIAIGIRLTSKGPVIFKQDRYGLDGQKIKVWKFRTMRTTENGAQVTQATRNDSRITPFGAFLRRTSLDELPQFFNVLQGTMSVVGPRPHAVAHNEGFRKQVDYYMLRHKMKPGITGWAQINGWRGETDTLEKMQMRIQYDLEYIQNWSLLMDFQIILATFSKGFVSKNAY